MWTYCVVDSRYYTGPLRKEMDAMHGVHSELSVYVCMDEQGRDARWYVNRDDAVDCCKYMNKKSS